ncbi:MAG: LuxR C-terminal-related transcriptional regulator [Candidatus Njordarchaeia archaeon]
MNDEIDEKEIDQTGDLEDFIVYLFSNQIAGNNPLRVLEKEINKRAREKSLEKLIKILEGLNTGKTSAEIAEDLDIKPVTIRTFLFNLKNRLGYPITLKVGKKAKLSIMGKILLRAAKLKQGQMEEGGTATLEEIISEEEEE